MGKVIAKLAGTRLPQQAIFGDRFVVECCESFHVHVRNLRLELGEEDFRRVMTALEETARTWRAHGEPGSHPHLELGRALVEGTHDPVFSVELCENLYKKWPTGWDARFHREDSFVHLHWRDLRMEMSNAEFLAIAEATGEAHAKLRAWTLKSLAEIFELLDREGIVYAVIRNWEKLPHDVEVGPHSDLDLLVHPDHEARFDALLDARPTTNDPRRVQRRIDVMTPAGPSFVLTDVRVPGDGYFPDALAHRMLARRVRHEGFWVLAAEDHLLGLAYHVVHHKGFATGDYWLKLDWLAGHTGHPRPDDADCTRYAVRLLEAARVEATEGDDPTVRPVLPLLHPRTSVVTSRFLAMHENQPVFSRVYVVRDDDGARVVKQTTGTFCRHEFEILRRLDGAGFPKVRAYRDLGGHSAFEMEHVEGTPLDRAEDLIRSWRFADARRFAVGLAEIGAQLAAAGVRHRDIRRENILVRDGRPVLLDFGWAETDDRPVPEPESGMLGGDARAPEGGPCDAYSLGAVMRQSLVALFPELEGVALELIEHRGASAPDWTVLAHRIEALEEAIATSPGERAVRLAERGRYDEARPLIEGLDEVTGDAAFWRDHLRVIDGGAPGEEPAEAPGALRRNAAIAARIVRERLGLHGVAPAAGTGATPVDPPGAMPGAAPAWLFALVREHLSAESPSLAFVDLVAEHLDAFVPGLDAAETAQAFARAGRRDEWLLRRARQLVARAEPAERRAFLAEVEASGHAPLCAAAIELARLCAREGRHDRARALARFVLDNDPYVVAAARLLAEATHETGAAAAAAWERVVRLCPGDRDARARRRQAMHAPVRETAAELPGSIDALVAFVRAAAAEKRFADAACAAARLAELSPEDAGAQALHAKLSALADRARADGHVRVVVDPLSERTYTPDPHVQRAELNALARTPLGAHPIVREAHARFVEASDPSLVRP